MEASVQANSPTCARGKAVLSDAERAAAAVLSMRASARVIAFGADVWHDLSSGRGAQELKPFTPLGGWRRPPSAIC
ncbi:hypothetical protein M8494_03230 [Serratia ureilytica]